MTGPLQAHLSDSVNALGDAARTMTEEIQADREQRKVEHAQMLERQRKSSRRVMALLLVVALLVAGLVLLSLANRKLGVANRQLNKQNSRIVERIESCTTVGGACYEQSKRANIAVAVCARKESNTDDIEACVQARIAGPAEAVEPPPSGNGPDGEPLPTVQPAPGPAQ